MKEKKLDITRNQMRKGMIEFCAMLIIERGKVYTSDILKELTLADLLVVEGTLYPLLSRLRSQGFLDYIWEESRSGPPRKYYTLTSDGKRVLSQSKESWKDLISSINSLIK